MVLDFLTSEVFQAHHMPTVFLITIRMAFSVTSASRASEIAALGAKEPFLMFFPDRVVLVSMLSFTTKVSSNFHMKREIVIPSFPEFDLSRELDVGLTLQEYLRMSAAVRQSDRLFVIPAGPKAGQAASKRMIATSLVKLNIIAYEARGLEPPRGISVHQTRGMVASWGQ